MPACKRIVYLESRPAKEYRMKQIDVLLTEVVFDRRRDLNDPSHSALSCHTYTETGA